MQAGQSIPNNICIQTGFYANAWELFSLWTTY
jgi:hypothetical protein